MNNNFENDIRQCVLQLKAGGAILYPTDTIWGLGCDAANEAAVEKIYAIKQRPLHKSFVVLLAEASDIFTYVAAPPPGIIDIIQSFEVPTTVVYEGALGLAPSVVAADGSVAIRVTTDPFCKALIKRWGGPLVSTSANLSGQPSPRFFREIPDVIRNGVDYVVEYRQADEAEKEPSRIVRVVADGTLERLR